MELFTDDVIGDLLADSLETAKFDGKAWSNPKHGHGASAGKFVKWHTIKDLVCTPFDRTGSWLR
jgi:carbonic anhydrase